LVRAFHRVSYIPDQNVIRVVGWKALRISLIGNRKLFDVPWPQMDMQEFSQAIQNRTSEWTKYPDSVS
jgi:hypothetical protein